MHDELVRYVHGLLGDSGDPGGHWWHRILSWGRRVHNISGRKVQLTNGRSEGTQHHVFEKELLVPCIEREVFMPNLTPIMCVGFYLPMHKKKKLFICGRWV